MSGFGKIWERIQRGRPPVGQTPGDVVFRENKWSLVRYRPKATPSGLPVLLVPSLINRNYVLDLLPGRSFVEYLVEAGHDVFMIDWGTPGPEDRYLGFETYVERYLGRAVRQTAKLAGAEKVHLLGYCLGGTLTTLYAAQHPEHIASMVALAAPIRFHDSGLLSIWTRTKNFDVGALVEAFGNVPSQLLQASFQLLKPTLNLSKLVSLIERSEDDDFLDAFFATETWGYDNVPFPGGAYRRYVEELYRGDALIRGEFYLSGRPVRLESIHFPTLAVTFEHDHIVPTASASILLERISSVAKQHLHLQGGHVGAVVAKKARATLWSKVSEFYRQHDERPPKRRSPKKPVAEA